ncbi:ABC transporter related protein [Trypanosoma theileri]|uniref:ABC transporter related protein n=1 Tax=Trypanosoma theileri TaxID=67003 RepID=A0A1X0NNU7_9TRYP|nr:ABC transporter related protein [Trypanosoma theileri]ORC86367.1 ABC transporter related protein [Trypanosoma theileri]
MWRHIFIWIQILGFLLLMSLIGQHLYIWYVGDLYLWERKGYEKSRKSSISLWENRLYAPTYITKIDNIYIIVDCWHHRVLYSENIYEPVGEWRDLVADIRIWIPHSVATNGDILVMESSDHGSGGRDHSLVVFGIIRGSQGKIKGFRFLQRIRLCPGKKVFRPHRVLYDLKTDAFYVYITNPPTFGKYNWSRKKQRLQYVYCEDLHFMEGVYARSFTFVNDAIIFTAGPKKSLTFAKLDGVNGTPRFLGRINVGWMGLKTGTMNDVIYKDNYWYITSSYPCSLIRVKSLRKGRIEMLHKKLQLCQAGKKGPGIRADGRCNHLGTPYYLSFIDGRMMIPFLFACSGILSFDPITKSATVLWGSGWTEIPNDVERRGTEW